MYTRMRLTRLRHTFLPGRGPLVRPSDRLQAGLLALVVLLSLAAAVGAVLFGIGEYSATAAKSREQTATRYTVTAVLLADGPKPVSAGHGGTPFDSAPTPATWRTRDGRQRVGEVEAAAGTVADHEVQIWLDETGAATERPLTMAAAIIGAPLGAATLWAAAVSLFVFLNRGAVLRAEPPPIRGLAAGMGRSTGRRHTPRRPELDRLVAGTPLWMRRVDTVWLVLFSAAMVCRMNTHPAQGCCEHVFESPLGHTRYPHGERQSQ
ncbi:Rv1733c family protein [Amycolatopsis sp. MEPSY49]|uniref:Rv1733c family protein n=1 Tax=Amycolatopsis sp. MEPSY49 TaxID=3151600 RepID=UPI003EF7DCB5